MELHRSSLTSVPLYESYQVDLVWNSPRWFSILYSISNAVSGDVSNTSKSWPTARFARASWFSMVVWATIVLWTNAQINLLSAIPRPIMHSAPSSLQKGGPDQIRSVASNAIRACSKNLHIMVNRHHPRRSLLSDHHIACIRQHDKALPILHQAIKLRAARD